MNLNGRKIPYRVDATSGEILVADSELANARTALGKTGLSASGTTGYEIFDRGGDMALTDFDQQVKLTRALEGELSRTITSVRGITHARVHIVLPHRQPFEHQRAEAQASVMLTAGGTRRVVVRGDPVGGQPDRRRRAGAAAAERDGGGLEPAPADPGRRRRTTRGPARTARRRCGRRPRLGCRRRSS